MASRGIQCQVHRLLDDAEEARTRFDRRSVRQCAEAALRFGTGEVCARLRPRPLRASETNPTKVDPIIKTA